MGTAGESGAPGAVAPPTARATGGLDTSQGGDMAEMILFGLLTMMAVVIVAGLLDRLLDFDELPTSTDGDPWGNDRR